MTPEQWSKLNTSWHHFFEETIESQKTNQPPYAEQALALTILSKNLVIEINDTLDYASGYGTLSKFLKKYLNTDIKIFDRYVRSSDKNLNYVA